MEWEQEWEQEECRSSSAGSCGHLATLPCSFTQPGLFPCQQHIVVCLYSSTFSSSLCLSLTLSFPLPLSLSASQSVPLCSNMSLCHLHDDNVFIILTQFQPRRSQTRRETVQQQQQQQEEQGRGSGRGRGKLCSGQAWVPTSLLRWHRFSSHVGSSQPAACCMLYFSIFGACLVLFLLLPPLCACPCSSHLRCP